MKKIGFALGLGFAAFASAAAAAEPGPYASIAAGLHMAEGTKFDVEMPPGGPSTNSNIQFETGYGLTAALGYRFEAFRAELEIGYRDAGAEAAGGHQSVVSGGVNVLFDVGIGEGIQPYVGGGVGIANTRWDTIPSPLGVVFHDESAKFQWQAIVGAEMPISPSTQVFVDYRYIGATDNSFSAGGAGRAVGADNASHNVLVGVRFNLGGFMQ